MTESSAQTRWKQWRNSPHTDAQTKAALAAIADQPKEIEERFSQTLHFGTAGLRGIMDVGTARMNEYTVMQATQGLASYILSLPGAQALADRGVVIAYDSRLGSERFSRCTAEVLAAAGIRVYLFPSLRPTPELSYSVRTLHCIAGINITASHNPKEYNGYKVYWEDGAQISPEQAGEVSSWIASTDIFEGVRSMPFAEALAAGKVVMLDDGKLDEAFLQAATALSIDKEAIAAAADSLTVVYTPLYGAGAVIVREALLRMGLKNLWCVEEQMRPDGNFPTLKNQNPEFEAVYELALELAREKDADLIIANDPDADRTGVMIRTERGKYRLLTGNQTGVLLLDYIIRARRKNGSMPEKPYAVKSIVSTGLADRICEKNGVELIGTLTGFKFIGEVITEKEKAGNRDGFLFGFEESSGYLAGSFVRDKDTAGTAVLLCEMAAAYKREGLTLGDALQRIYAEYGLHIEQTDNVEMKGMDGSAKMQALLTMLRAHSPREIGGQKIVAVRDILSGVDTDLLTGAATADPLPSSDVLCYRTERGNTIVIRPSGTEPKIKIYYMFRADAQSPDEISLRRDIAACINTTAGWVR